MKRTEPVPPQFPAAIPRGMLASPRVNARAGSRGSSGGRQPSIKRKRAPELCGSPSSLGALRVRARAVPARWPGAWAVARGPVLDARPIAAAPALQGFYLCLARHRHPRFRAVARGRADGVHIVEAAMAMSRAPFVLAAISLMGIGEIALAQTEQPSAATKTGKERTVSAAETPAP